MLKLEDILGELERTEIKKRALEVLRDLHLEMGAKALSPAPIEATVAEPEEKPKKTTRARQPKKAKAAPAPKGKKYCPGCEKDLATSAFGKDNSKASGLASRCIPCSRAAQKAWRHKREGKTPAQSKAASPATSTKAEKPAPATPAAPDRKALIAAAAAGKTDPRGEVKCDRCSWKGPFGKAGWHLYGEHKINCVVEQVMNHFTALGTRVEKDDDEDEGDDE